MTRREGLVDGQRLPSFFISLGGPKVHDSSLSFMSSGSAKPVDD
jgi:hypothetical protein